MATDQQTTNTHIMCLLCSDVFTDPATLKCDHTFCRPCILKCIKTQPDLKESESIPCPICQHMTKMDFPERPVVKWIDELKPSPIIQELMEHNESKKHNKDAKDVSDLSPEMEYQSRPFICKVHQEEIKAFCQDCNISVCHTCCCTSHKNCKSLVSIQESLPEVKCTIWAKKLDLENQIKRRHKRMSARNIQMDKFKKDTDELESEIKSFSKIAMLVIEDEEKDFLRKSEKAKREVTEKEKHLLEKLKSTRSNHINIQQADGKRDKMAVQVYQQQSQFIEKSLETNSRAAIYHMYEKCITEHPSNDTEIPSPVLKIGLKLNRVTLRKNLLFIGGFYAKTVGDIYTVNPGDTGRMSMPVQSQVIKTESGRITDLAVIEVSGIKCLVLVDESNSCLKGYYTVDNEVRETVLELQHKPFGITIAGENMISVTVPPIYTHA